MINYHSHRISAIIMLSIVLQFITITTTIITVVNANYIELSSSYSLLRGSPYIDDQYNEDITNDNKKEEDEEHRKIINLRKLLSSSSDQYYSTLSYPSHTNSSSTISNNSTTRYTGKWLNLTNDEIQLLSYDKSSLNYMNQNLLGSVYLVGRGRQSSTAAMALDEQQFETLDKESSANKSADATDDKLKGENNDDWSITSFLRGKSTSATIHTKDRLSPPRRKLQQLVAKTVVALVVVVVVVVALLG